MASTSEDTRILILATLSGGYAGANAVGQMHASYAPNTYILPVMSPAMFSEDFYLRAFERGIDAILVMYSGTDSPYKGDAEHTAQMINRVYPLMTERGINTRRLRLVAICTVCTAAFQKEIRQMNDTLAEIGPVRAELAAPHEQSA
ncbi:MAG: hydrogenase iron-sulfur subunit [Anaerolineae bacterium]|nr:hydrogenase iron-sulfur subunit [Anaerolineae bacterium]